MNRPLNKRRTDRFMYTVEKHFQTVVGALLLAGIVWAGNTLNKNTLTLAGISVTLKENSKDMERIDRELLSIRKRLIWVESGHDIEGKP